MPKPEWKEELDLDAQANAYQPSGTGTADNVEHGVRGLPDMGLSSDSSPLAYVQHILHETIQPGPTFTVRVEKNSRSINTEIAVHGARSPEEAVESLQRLKVLVDEKVKGLFEGPVGSI